MKNLLLALALIAAGPLAAQMKTKVFQVETIPAGYEIADRNDDGFNEIVRSLLSDTYVAPGLVTGQTAADTTGTALFALLDSRIDAAVAGSVADLSIAGGNLEAGGTPVALLAISPIQTVTLNGTPVNPNGAGLLALTDANTQLNEAAVDGFVSNNGYLTTEVDGSTTNELQDPSFVLATGVLSLSSSATTVNLAPLKNETPRVDIDAFTATAGQTVFTLPNTPSGSREVYMRNGLPFTEAEWSRAGTTLTLTPTPALQAGEVIGYDFHQ